MPLVRTVCPNCHDTVELSATEIQLHLDEDVADPRQRVVGRYGFRCPRCDVFVHKPTDGVAAGLLVIGDVAVSVGARAPWDPDPSPRPAGVAPLAADEVEHWAEALADPSWQPGPIQA